MLRVGKHWLVGTVVAVASCGRESVNPAGPVDRVPVGVEVLPVLGAVIQVSDVAALYAEVEKTVNAGATILLAPGTYPLTRALELQQDMSLLGEGGNRDAVIVDATDVPAGTGAVRIGRGANSISTLTLQKAPNPGAVIATDLASALPSRITISNVIVTGGRRGIDVRNGGTAGRVLTVSITNSEIHHNTLGVGQGIRMVNLAGATGGVISTSLSGNNVHHNRIGCFVGNNGVNSATIAVESNRDTVEFNGVGCGVAAGVASANYNVVSFMAESSIFRSNNSELLPAGITDATRAGFTVEGGSSSTANSASFNTASVVLQNPVFGDNTGADVRAWGANSTATAPAGTNNVASVVIAGAPAAIEQHWASVPGPAGTNTVSVVKY